MENEPFHILLADDDKTTRFLFTEAFATLKVKTIVRTVNDGIELMEYLVKKNSLLPHLLFLDLKMPGKNGLECLKEIRSNEKLKDISIAIYSTSVSEEDMDETFHHGANIYINKPAHFDVLKQVLEKAVMTAYQYQDQSMNKENFFLSI